MIDIEKKGIKKNLQTSLKKKREREEGYRNFGHEKKGKG